MQGSKRNGQILSSAERNVSIYPAAADVNLPSLAYAFAEHASAGVLNATNLYQN
jgi:hypothetical protein